MSALPSPDFEILPPVRRSVDAPVFHITGQERERFTTAEEPRNQQSSPRRRSRPVTMFFLGVAATLAWQSYGHAARERIARLSPQLQWLAPPAAATPAEPDRVEQISHNVDEIAANIIATHEQIARSIDHLAGAQEQITREITRLQAISQYSSGKIQEPLPPAVRKAVQRSSHMH